MKIEILLISIFLPIWALAQVGVNTTNPQGIFHLDAQNSTATTNPEAGTPTITQLSDDVIVSSAGNVGVGGAPLSTQKLLINGQLKMTDGTQATGRVMTAAADGIAYWNTSTAVIGEKIGYWGIITNNLRLNTSEQTCQGTTELGTNTLGLTMSSNAITVPKGRYLIVINGDISGHEFGIYRVKISPSNTTLFTIYNRSWLSGFYDYCEFTVNTTLYITYQPIIAGLIYWGGKTADNSNVNMTFNITFLKLKD